MPRFAASLGAALAGLQLAAAALNCDPPAAAAGTAVLQLKLHMLAAGEGGNACLDGTPFGYYVATNASSRDWVIDIAGGGWCDSAASCVNRIASSSRLASSITWGPTSGGNGITSGSASDNPEYSSYNRVFFPYCDGSSVST